MPTAYWVRLRVPRVRPIVEFVTLLPFVIPPVVLVFGLIRVYSRPPLPLTNTDIGSTVLLAFGVRRAVAAVHVPGGRHGPALDRHPDADRGRPEHGRRLVHDPLAVILPNLRVAILSRAFLTLAIVIGEFTIASFLARPAFGPYLSLLGNTKAYEPAAVSLISFGLTWLAMIAHRGPGPRRARPRISLGGAH